jgi:hypothetical protein
MTQTFEGFKVGDAVRFANDLPPQGGHRNAIWVVTALVKGGGATSYTRAQVQEILTGFTAVRGFHRLEKVDGPDV